VQFARLNGQPTANTRLPVAHINRFPTRRISRAEKGTEYA